jgi:hypothetical protein
MVKLALHSIAYEAKTLNLAKSGYTAFYVDGTDGLDIHDGGSWAQAFKTIQHAIDESSSWGRVFIKAGTYIENVVVAKDGISLEGQSRDTVKIQPSTGTALTISNPNFRAESISTVSNVLGVYSTVVNGRYCILDDFGTIATIAYGRGIYVNASNCDLQSIYNSDALTGHGIIFAAGLHNSEIRESYLNLTKADSIAIGLASNATDVLIYNNTMKGCMQGVDSNPGTENNTIFHNNFLSVTLPIDGADNDYFENYYSGHTNVDNGTGIATDPYTPGTASDPRPVVVRNGWKQISLGSDIAGRSIGNQQMAATMINLNQAAATYTLFTGTTQAVMLEGLSFRMPNVDISGGALTSISIQTDDVTPAVIISAADGVLANLTHEASLTWTGALLIPIGTFVQLTIATGTAGSACTCDIVAKTRAVVTGGYLA